MRLVAYTRVTTEAQAEPEKVSVDEQGADIEAYAAGQDRRDAPPRGEPWF